MSRKPMVAVALLCGMLCLLAAQAVATPIIGIHTEAQWREALQTGLIQPVPASVFQQMITDEPAWPQEYREAEFATPTLEVTGDYQGEAGLVMSWEASEQPGQRVAAAWDYVYPVDPNLGAATVEFSIFPPVASTFFSLNLIDQHGNYREWIWHAGNPGEPVPGQWSTVSINPASGWSNYLPVALFTHDVPGFSFDLSSVTILRFNENISSFFPGQQWPPGPGGIPEGWLWNAWNHVVVSPEPSTFIIWGLALLGLGVYGRRRRTS